MKDCLFFEPIFGYTNYCKIITNEDEKEHFSCGECKQEFSIYSLAPDRLESLNREKIIEICDESNAKGFRSVAGCRSSLINSK